MLCLVFGAFGSGVFAQGDAVQADVRARAEAAYDAGDLLGALPDYERLVSLFPEEACLHGRLAGCALKEPGRLSLVRRHLRIALRMGCSDVDLGFHQARLAQLEYDFDRARDLYAAYLVAAGKKGRFKAEAESGAMFCENADWQPSEAVPLEVFERIPSDPDAAFRYYDPEVEGLRLVATPASLRSKADLKLGQGRMALHDGDTVLVFASLGKKGATGWDLYRVSIRQGAYTEPVVLEGDVNSEFDEKDAYLSKEGILYYASNRPGGLGGFDIYAVTCGLDGSPTGAPYRLPYPINSVNDDVFFIPEADGGAWMASNRAAVEGKVHAYRIGLGEGEMATGSIAWSADEVEGEGFKLRVFASGEEVSVGELNGDAAAHLAFSGGESVRIVLEDAEGQVLAESFGAGEGAWELKKTSEGWSFEDKTDVLADWAVLSDLQVGAATGTEPSVSPAAFNDGGLADNDGAGETTGRGWAAFIDARSNDIAAVVAVNEGAPLSETPEETVPPVSIAAPAAEVVEEGGDTAIDIEPSGEADASPPLDLWTSGDVESLVRQTPESPEWVEEMLAATPEVVVEIWEAKAAQILTLEQGFLDAPDFNKAGALYDLLDEMDAWVPQGELMTPLLQDGADVADMRDMLDEWSYAVQSASKASLAKVAGEAALAYRRDRLAIRELWEVSEIDLTPLKGRWSNWRDAHRELPGTDPEDADLTNEEGSLLLGQWEGVLTAAGDVWSRKERSGWRGDWLRRQEVELELSKEFWESELEQAAQAEVPEDLLSESDQVAVNQAAGEPPSADQGRSASDEEALTDLDEDNSSRVLIEGDADVSLVAQLMPAAETTSETLTAGNTLLPNGTDWANSWDSAVALSKDVSRQWERLSKASDGQGVAPLNNGADLETLSPALRSAYTGLVQSVLDELVALRSQWSRSRRPVVAQWEEREFAGMGNSDAMTEVRNLWRSAQQAEEAAEALQRGRNEGEAEAFDRLLAQREALADAESAWRAWESAWMQMLESEAAQEESLEAEATEAVTGPLDGAEVDVTDAQLEDLPQEDTADQAQPVEVEVPVEVVEPVEVVGLTEGPGPTEDSVALAPEPQTSTESSDAPAVSDNTEVATLDWTEVLEGSSRERIARVSSIMAAMDADQQSDQALVLKASEMEALSAWRARLELIGNDPGVNAGRAARMAWDKRMFFNERRLRAALNALDLDQIERKLNGEAAEEPEVSVSVLEEARTAGADLIDINPPEEGPAMQDDVVSSSEPQPAEDAIESTPPNAVVSEEVALSETASEAISEGVESAAVERQNADVAAYGLVLPEAEVWGSSSNRSRNGGLTLRPIDRVDLERSILGRAQTAPEDEAAERFASPSGAPVAEGVEYKIQIGAFRKALPAALFAAFDPMWAQELPNGITRYMAGSFDLYDPAVAARDAIRALGYEDAFVVRFVDGERLRASRPEPLLLAEERASAAGADVLSPRPVGATLGDAAPIEGAAPSTAVNDEGGATSVPTRREDIPTWDGIAGRVYSVQVGAFRGVPDAEAMASLGTLTREDAGSDGWLRLFSGRFATQSEAEAHRRDLRNQGRSDAFIVVYINGRRIPLSQASLTSVAPLPGARDEAASVATVEVVPESLEQEDEAASWCVELGVFNSTIPVRLANAILDAPLQWQIRSVRNNGLTRYRTAFVAEGQARTWLMAAQAQGFTNAQLVQE